MALTQDLRFVGTLIANTLDARLAGKGIEQIHRNVALLYGMGLGRGTDLGMGKGIVPFRGGNKIRFTIVNAENPNFKWYDKFETLTATSSEEETDGFDVMRNASAMVGVDGPSLDDNRGPAQVRDITREKVDEMERTFREKLEIALMQGKVGTTGANPTRRFQPLDKAPNPLGFLIQKEFSNLDLVHEINQNTETYWQNQALNATGLTGFNQLFKAVNDVYMRTMLQGDITNPDLGLCDTFTYQTLEAMLFSTGQRWGPFGTNPNGDSVSAGFRNVQFKDMLIYASPFMPNYGTGADATGPVSLTIVPAQGVLLFLNTAFLKLYVSDRRNFSVGEPTTPYDQDAAWVKMLGRYQLVCTSRRKQGVLYNINNPAIIAP